MAGVGDTGCGLVTVRFGVGGERVGGEGVGEDVGGEGVGGGVGPAGFTLTSAQFQNSSPNFPVLQTALSALAHEDMQKEHHSVASHPMRVKASLLRWK